MEANSNYYLINKTKDIEVISDTTGNHIRTEQKVIVEGGVSIRDKLAHDYFTAMISTTEYYHLSNYNKMECIEIQKDLMKHAFILAEEFIKTSNNGK